MAPAGVIPPDDGPQRTRLWAPTDALGSNPHCLGRNLLSRKSDRIFREIAFGRCLRSDEGWRPGHLPDVTSTPSPIRLQTVTILSMNRPACKALFSDSKQLLVRIGRAHV